MSKTMKTNNLVSIVRKGVVAVAGIALASCALPEGTVPPRTVSPPPYLASQQIEQDEKACYEKINSTAYATGEFIGMVAIIGLFRSGLGDTPSDATLRGRTIGYNDCLKEKWENVKTQNAPE